MKGNKFVIVGDLHCSPTTLNITYQLFEILKNYPDYIPVFLGDFFHSKNRLDSRFLIELFNILSTYKDECLVISGNHDFIDKNTSLINILPSNFIKILFPAVIELDTYNLAILPYTTPTDEAKLFISENANDNTILLSHIVIDQLTDLNLESFPKELFDNYKAVVNGHIHTSTIKDNIIQPGAVYPVSVSEIDSYNPFLTFIEDGVISDVKPITLFSIITTEEYNPELNSPDVIIKTSNQEVLAKYDNAFKVLFTGKKETANTVSNVLDLKQSVEETLKDQILKAGLTETQLTLLKETLPEEFNLWNIKLITDDTLDMLDTALKEIIDIKEKVVVNK
jgi:DNA repair exonuclease SbcCD nuclease subunit